MRDVSKDLYRASCASNRLNSQHYILIFTVGQPPVLQLLSRRFWGFFAGATRLLRNLRNMSMKFGTAEGTTAPRSPPPCQISRSSLGVSGPKTRNIANPLPDVDEICSVYASNRSTKAINIWCDSVSKLGIYRQKNRDGAFPQNFRSHLAPKLLGGLKKSRGCKNGTDMLYLRAKLMEIRRCTAEWETKVGCFFVCLSRSGSWTEV